MGMVDSEQVFVGLRWSIWFKGECPIGFRSYHLFPLFLAHVLRVSFMLKREPIKQSRPSSSPPRIRTELMKLSQACSKFGASLTTSFQAKAEALSISELQGSSPTSLSSAH